MASLAKANKVVKYMIHEERWRMVLLGRFYVLIQALYAAEILTIFVELESNGN